MLEKAFPDSKIHKLEGGMGQLVAFIEGNILGDSLDYISLEFCEKQQLGRKDLKSMQSLLDIFYEILAP